MNHQKYLNELIDSVELPPLMFAGRASGKPEMRRRVIKLNIAKIKVAAVKEFAKEILDKSRDGKVDVLDIVDLCFEYQRKHENGEI